MAEFDPTEPTGGKIQPRIVTARQHSTGKGISTNSIDFLGRFKRSLNISVNSLNAFLSFVAEPSEVREFTDALI